MSAYLMESDREGERIRRKTKADTSREHLALAGLEPGMRAIDVGCAGGEVLREMARIVHPARVVGFDASAERIAESGRMDRDLGCTNIDYQIGDVDDIQLPDDQFDFVWSRFLFEYLPEPIRALRELKRIARPGGKVVVADLDGNCAFNYPLSDELSAGLAEIFDLIGARTGFDPFVGRKLYSYFFEVGLKEIKVDLRPYHTVFGAPSPEVMAQWEQKIRIFQDNFQKLSPEKYRTAAPLFEGFLDFLAREDTVTYSILFMVQGVK
ncbi:MAG: methyltransferase domain-containing protein [Proteobacteria bacterium]|nr:methyltransferase domain-containing protein [Pseudomonadota bacterium]